MPSCWLSLLTIVSAYGVIFKAREKASNANVAIKEIVIQEEVQVKSISSEISIMKKVHHPTIVEFKGKALSKSLLSLNFLRGMEERFRHCLGHYGTDGWNSFV